MPQTFGTITVSDGISMGTEGMKYSLVSREVIADSIETACNAQCMDGLLAVGGCDKNMPGAMIAMARMNIPAVFVYGGTIKPGHYKDRDLTVVSVFEAVGEYSARKIDAAELLEVERRACPGAGSCGGMFTANTMSSVFEAMGMSLPYSSTMAAEDAEKADSAARSAEVLVRAIRTDLRPRHILTRQAFENAIAVTLAIGGAAHTGLRLPALPPAAPGPPPPLRLLATLGTGAGVRLGGSLPRRHPRGEDPGGGCGRDSLRGAERRARHAGDALPDLRDHRGRARRRGGSDHRRAVLGRHPWPRRGPRGTGSGGGRDPGAGGRGRRDHDRRRAATAPTGRAG